MDANPGMKGQVLTDDGSLHRFVNVYLNDDDVRYLDKLDTAGVEGRHHLDPARSGRRLRPETVAGRRIRWHSTRAFSTS